MQRTPQTAKTKQAEVVDVTQSPAISSLAKVTARVDELEADILAALSAPQNTPKQRSRKSIHKIQPTQQEKNSL